MKSLDMFLSYGNMAIMPSGRAMGDLEANPALASTAFLDMLTTLGEQGQRVSGETAIEAPALMPRNLSELEDLFPFLELSQEQWQELESFILIYLQADPARQADVSMEELQAKISDVLEANRVVNDSTYLDSKKTDFSPEQRALISKIAEMLQAAGKAPRERELPAFSLIPSFSVKKTLPLETKFAVTESASSSPVLSAAVDEAIPSGMEARPETIRIGHHQFVYPTLLHSSQPNLAPQTAMAAPFIRAQHFVPEMTDFLLSQMKITKVEGMTEAKISLFPEHLGQVDVRVSIHQGQVTAQFVAETLAGRDMLESNLASLRHVLTQQGLQVDRMEVLHADDSALDSHQQQPREGSPSFQQQSRSHQTSVPGGTDIHSADEREEAIPERILSYGESPSVRRMLKIDVTA